MESNGSHFNSPPPLTAQYYHQDEEYVQMFPTKPTSIIGHVGNDSRPPALPPKPPSTSYGGQSVSRSAGSRWSVHGNAQWSNPPTNPTANYQWHNNTTMHPNSPWDHTPTPPTRSQWNNPHNVVHWNNTSAVPNQGLEMQQNRLENSRLQNEIERLRQQLKQQQHQTPNDVWLIEQNHELHARVARLTQENDELQHRNDELRHRNDELRHRLSSIESELTVLQHSLKTHEEDFQQERRDRVRIHEEKEKLQQQLESQEQVIKMLTEERGGRLVEMENNMGLGNERRPCERCNRMLYPNEMFEHQQKCIQ